jgi:hypothetical protein
MAVDALKANIEDAYKKYDMEAASKKLKQDKPDTEPTAAAHPYFKRDGKKYHFDVTTKGLNSNKTFDCEKADLHKWVMLQTVNNWKAKHNEISQSMEQLQTELDALQNQLDHLPDTPQRNDIARQILTTYSEKAEQYQALIDRKGKIQRPVIPTMKLVDNTHTDISKQILSTQALSAGPISITLEPPSSKSLSTIRQALQHTEAFKGDDETKLTEFRALMRKMMAYNCDNLIGGLTPTWILSAEESKILKEARQNINNATLELLDNPERPGAMESVNYLRLQEVLLDRYYWLLEQSLKIDS